MPKCPHCGETYRYGQDKCYACGQPVKGRRGGGGQVNPLYYIIGGGLVVIALLGTVLVTARGCEERRLELAKLEEQRIADSVRQANIEARAERRRTRREDSDAGIIADLEHRLERVVARADRGRLNPEQTGMVSEVDAMIARLNELLESMSERSDEDQTAISDTIQTEAAEVRGLLNQLGRRRRSGP